MATEQDLKINTLEVMMDQNTSEHKELKETMLALSLKLDDSLEKMENNFAPMWVKSIVIWIGGVIGSFLILLALSNIFIK